MILLPRSQIATVVMLRVFSFICRIFFSAMRLLPLLKKSPFLLWQQVDVSVTATHSHPKQCKTDLRFKMLLLPTSVATCVSKSFCSKMTESLLLSILLSAGTLLEVLLLS